MISKLFEILKKHWMVLVFAMAVSIVYGSHHFFISTSLQAKGIDYYPVAINAPANDDFDEATVYATRAHAVELGQFPVSDVNLLEYKDHPSTFPVIPPLIMGALAKLLGSLKNAVIFADFLFPALIFLALYFLFFELTERKILSLVSATLFIFAPKIALYLPPASSYALGQFIDDLLIPTTITDRLYFSKFEPPQLTYIFFIPTLYLVLRALKRKEKYTTILAGIFFGSLFYTYFHDWTYVIVSLSFIFILFLLQKNYSQMKRIASIVSIGFIVSTFFWINFFDVSNLAHYEDIVSRMGKALTESFNLDAWKTYIRSSGLAILLWVLWRKRDLSATNYLIGFLLPIFVLLNIQVLIGYTIADKHWYDVQYIVVFMGFMVLMLWFYEKYLSDIPKRYFLSAAGIFAAFLFSSQLYDQYIFSNKLGELYTINEKTMASYSWLEENTPKYSVVGSLSQDTNSEILTYSHNKIYVPNGVSTLAPNDELWERLAAMSFISGMPLEEYSEYISHDGKLLSYVFHHSPIVSEFPEDLYGDKIKEYHSLILTGKDKFEIPHTLDYIYFGPHEKKFGNDPIEVLPELEIVYDEEEIKIYAVGD